MNASYLHHFHQKNVVSSCLCFCSFRIISLSSVRSFRNIGLGEKIVFSKKFLKFKTAVTLLTLCIFLKLILGFCLGFNTIYQKKEKKRILKFTKTKRKRSENSISKRNEGFSSNVTRRLLLT